MKDIIMKSGDAFIYTGITSAKNLEHLIPENTSVHKIFPCISFFAIGVFKYRQIIDLRPGNEEYRWENLDNLYDILVQVPVDYHNTKNMYYMHRLYNGNSDVVQWAKGDNLNKTHCDVTWKNNDKDYSVTVSRREGGKEKLSLKGQALYALPKVLWKFNPFHSLIHAYLLSKYQGETYSMEGVIDMGPSYFGLGTLEVEGLDLPKALISTCFFLKNYNALHIKKIMKLYHACEYNAGAATLDLDAETWGDTSEAATGASVQKQPVVNAGITITN